MINSRLASIDMVRGVSILLVVAFHTNTDSIINGILSGFRMPLFFLLSGFLFSQKYFTNSKLLLKTRIKTLLLPYFSAALFFYLLFVLRTINQDDASLSRTLVGLFYGNSPDGWLIINEPLWFLLCLFCTQVIFGIVMKFIKTINSFFQLLVFFAISIVGVLIGKIMYLPWSIDVALVCQIFTFVGYKLKEQKILDKFNTFSFVTLILAIIFAVATYYNQTIDVGYRIYNNVFLFFLAGISGSIIVFKIVNLCASIKWVSKILTYIGRESLIILIFHGGFFLYVIGVIGNRFGVTIHWSISLFFSIAGSLVIAEIIKRIPIANFFFNGKSMHKPKITNKTVKMKNV